MIKILIFLLISFSIQAATPDVKTYIPPKAFQYFDLIKKESRENIPEFSLPFYFGSLIEHESCISLTHSRCWSSNAQLKSARELGVGLGQITKAYRPDGRIRFDSLNGMKRLYPTELRELSWDNVRDRPDLQIKTIVLMFKDLWKGFYNIEGMGSRLAFSNSAYNGGTALLAKERRACGLADRCDPNLWFDNVEKYCIRSRKALYSGRSACEINRHHTSDVLLTRLSKYMKAF